MSEEKINGAEKEIGEDELENVTGGVRLSTGLKFVSCPCCHSTNVGKVSPRVYRCRDCDHHFAP